MGMEGKLRQVSEFELAEYRKNPAKLYSDLIAMHEWPDRTGMMSAMHEIGSSPLALRIRQRALSGQPPLQEDVDAYRKQVQELFNNNGGSLEDLQSQFMGPSKDGKVLSLYKSWHRLHFLLTGKGWERNEFPLGKAIMGGEEIPDVQNVMGYGPARYLTPAEVDEVAKALNQFPIEARSEAFDAAAADAAKVYGPNHEAEELIEFFNWLRDFYQTAAAHGNAVLLWVE
jgi:hypothetical protein